MYYHAFMSTPMGRIVLVCDEQGALTHLYTGPSSEPLPGVLGAQESEAVTAPWRKQLEEFFAGTRRSFDLPIAPRGSDWQRKVWERLLAIPFGETRTYGQLAKDLGVPNASRAVGRANATNPISIVVPCHRVIGASGALTGYAGGLANKQWLLEFEGAAVPTTQPPLEV